MPRSANHATVSHAGSSAGRPQVQAGHRVVDAEARTGQRRPQHLAPAREAGALRGHVRVVRQRGGHRRLDRPRHDHARLLAGREQPRHQRRVTGHEAGAVAGQAGALGQRVDREHAVERVAADRRVQHRHGLGVPAEREVALVGDHDRAALAGPVDDLAQVFGRQHLAGRVRGGVEPEQRRPVRAERDRAVRTQQAGAGELHADLVGRVRERRDDHEIVGAEPEQGRQPGDELLRADGRQHRVGGQARHAVAPGQRVDRGLAQLGRAVRGRVAGLGGGRRQRVLDQPGNRVHRRADGQVHDAVRMRPRAGTGLRQRVPGKSRQRPGHSSCWTGGRSLIHCGSAATLPTLAAPPGEPSSSK